MLMYVFVGPKSQIITDDSGVIFTQNILTGEMYFYICS